MRHTALLLTAALALCALSTDAFGNAPPPWHACSGAAVGDTCTAYRGNPGICERREACSDAPETPEDECMWCEADPSAGGCQLASARLWLPGASVSFTLLLLFWSVLRRRRRDRGPGAQAGRSQ